MSEAETCELVRGIRYLYDYLARERLSCLVLWSETRNLSDKLYYEEKAALYTSIKIQMRTLFAELINFDEP